MVSSKVVGAGAFVVIGLLLFTAALFLIGERRMLFSDRFTIYTEFAKLGQLEPGAIVRVSGADAGEVTAIEVPRSPEGKFRVEMEIREDLHQLIRRDSLATSQTDGLVGAVFLNIATGTEEQPQIPEGGTIPSREPFSVADLMQQASETVALVQMTVETLKGDVEIAVQQIALTAEDAHGLLRDIRPDITAMAANGKSITTDTQQMIARVNNGEGSLGKLLNDDALYTRVRDIADEAKTVVANVRQMSDEARRAISDFRSDDGPAMGLFADMRVTLGQAREATADLADNMEAMKHNILLRGFFNRRGYFDLDAISPAQYREGVLENGKRKAMRIWLSSDVLYEEGPGGEVLSAEGRARVDSAMEAYLRYLPANPIVVEGFATTGTIGEQYRLSRQRAGIVREYLMGQYDLPSQSTGFIALGTDSEGSPSGTGKPWDGVSITLFLDTAALQFADQQASR
jgi:phospholipid/cholesterol/gamma-HCH transport system substrate-binding protein